MKISPCKSCRKIMRIWALDWRRKSDTEIKLLCLKTAKLFRRDSQETVDGSLICIHTPVGGAR